MPINLQKTSVLPKFKLQEKASIYVPSTYALNVKIVNDKFVQKIEKEMATIFGGSTTMETSGNYVSEIGTLVKEKINVVYSFTEKIGNAEIDKLVQLCEYLKREMKQESVALEINGSMYFV